MKRESYRKGGRLPALGCNLPATSTSHEALVAARMAIVVKSVSSVIDADAGLR